MHMSKFIKLYNLNVFILLYLHNTSIHLLKKRMNIYICVMNIYNVHIYNKHSYKHIWVCLCEYIKFRSSLQVVSKIFHSENFLAIMTSWHIDSTSLTQLFRIHHSLTLLKFRTMWPCVQNKWQCHWELINDALFWLYGINTNRHTMLLICSYL